MSREIFPLFTVAIKYVYVRVDVLTHFVVPLISFVGIYVENK